MAKINYSGADIGKWATAKHGIIQQASAIIEEYRADGLDLTLRQLYYQFVARGILANKQSNYKRLGTIMSDARMAGLIDWNTIVDRTRNVYGTRTWSDPGSFIHSMRYQFAIDWWEGQDNYVEVWVEKEALASVIGRAASQMRVDYFPCRGYVSQSAQWRAARRLVDAHRSGRNPVIIHLGDHDPSGIDMTRDIYDRLATFCQHDAGFQPEVRRIALTMDQVEAHTPPPNPAKLTDTRAADYVAKYGHESWELDALDPHTLIDLITNEVEGLITDPQAFQDRRDLEVEYEDKLDSLAQAWPQVERFLDML